MYLGGGIDGEVVGEAELELGQDVAGGEGVPGGGGEGGRAPRQQDGLGGGVGGVPAGEGGGELGAERGEDVGVEAVREQREPGLQPFVDGYLVWEWVGVSGRVSVV